MCRRVAILQSNYIPWKGYFDIIHDVDLFVFHDDIQYTKDDWRNRNRIKTAAGLRWLTVPVGRNEHRLISEVSMPDSTAWATEHWRLLQGAYAHAPHFSSYRSFFEEIYLGTHWTTLSDLNQTVIRRISRELLGIKTEFDDSRRHALASRKQERVIELLKKIGAKTYVSGPAAKSYLHADRLAAEGIEVVWKDYAGYPEYPQSHAPFEHAVSIVDLLFHIGSRAPDYIWGWRRAPSQPTTVS